MKWLIDGVQGIPSPPGSPPFGVTKSAKTYKGRAKEAARIVAEESERLFCGALQAAFLGEGNPAERASFATNAHRKSDTIFGLNGGGPLPSPPDDLDIIGNGSHVFGTSGKSTGLVQTWLEVWDYTGGARFRGFIAESQDERLLFVFFDNGVQGHDLKPGYGCCHLSISHTYQTLMFIDLWHCSNLLPSTNSSAPV